MPNFRASFLRRNFRVWWLVVVSFLLAKNGQGAACVWKVSAKGHTLYLAGSIHVLRGSDYPLPAAYEQAFQASSTLAFESEGNASVKDLFGKGALLPKGTTLRDHLDPRVYDYVRQMVAGAHASVETAKAIEHLRPWVIGWMLQSPNSVDGLSYGQGVETYLRRKAVRAHKKMVGLVKAKEHLAVFGGMNDADGQAFLLLGLVQLNQHSQNFQRTVKDWKAGDVVSLERAMKAEYNEVPSLRRRMLDDRNHRWVPEITQWLESGQTYMVVAGCYHMLGSEGLPALLKARGYQVEQL